jgi:predicted Rossmann fold flavoprotein
LVQHRNKVIVVGAGAAGLMAAGQSANSGSETLLLEKMPHPGRKLRITGKGRCNITNIAEANDFIGHFGVSGRFLRQSFARFFVQDLIAFFGELGLDLITERGGRVFPASGKAPDVVATLVGWVKESGVSITYSSPARKLMIRDGAIKGIETSEQKYFCSAVILATGGKSYPATGSTGDGYTLAASAGHTIVPVRPALVPLETDAVLHQEASGLNLRNIKVTLLINDKKRSMAFGEMGFTDNGVTGPVILSLSGLAVDGLRDNENLELSIDLKPALDEKKLDARLLRDFAHKNREPLDVVLRGLLPRQLIPACIRMTEIDAGKAPNSITAKERKRLRDWLKDFRIQVTGHRPYSEALITAGGVDTREVDPRTMESRLVKGLYFAGELMDIQADTGGYNLQAAFSTGWLAGRSAAGKLQRI